MKIGIWIPRNDKGKNAALKNSSALCALRSLTVQKLFFHQSGKEQNDFIAFN